MKTNPITVTKLPHMGTLIKNKIEQHTISYAEVARRLNVKPPIINGY
ncbi:hypothetical protein [Flavobacterium sp.]|nr:hypothetical protein [Flavobacterium sp.]MDI1315889.1 hypothetical protein [Flavobacterium sp.]